MRIYCCYTSHPGAQRLGNCPRSRADADQDNLLPAAASLTSATPAAAAALFSFALYQLAGTPVLLLP
jgi:hypothetical protein